MKKKVIFCLGLFILTGSIAISQTEEELWKKLVMDPNENNVKLFIAHFPKSALMPDVANLLWGKCEADVEGKACDLYIRYFPEGEHVPRAKDIAANRSDLEVIVDATTDVLEDIIDVMDDDPDDKSSSNGSDTNEEDQSAQPENNESNAPGRRGRVSVPVKKQDEQEKNEENNRVRINRTKSGDARHTANTASKTRSAKTTGTSEKAAAVVADYQVKHNVTQQNRKGMLFSLTFTVTGCAGKKCLATVHFLDENQKPVIDTNKKFANSSGKAVADKSFAPNQVSANYKDLQIFMPYGELHKKGKVKIYYYVTIQCAKKTLAKTKARSFQLTWK